ncbi:class I adenylate-forming enzyme family protein [Amycolatopsis vancoresmycina]|uniref:AMP-dependent synthetase/ligase n=1 Tax=Amycolatopsis vancoresmycina DSM 44592 TaxID=1292037 RepID=R1I1G1_9PSEU|nr:fatty acid--CoA ligase family protein [Amycolatopsis vancoresmycina]EOD66361.1 AMP-dependent synthetase/ligase [Amycolatopsis vancoresmycina DSM 44592]
MSAVWTSTAGVAIPDLVPGELRRAWVRQGRCPGTDIYRSFTEHVDAHPDRQAVLDDAGPVTYAELDHAVSATAAGLLAAGLGRRDVIGIRMVNSRHAVAAELAVAAVGAVSMPFPAGRGRRDALSLLRRAKATGLLVDRGTEGLRALPSLRVTLAPEEFATSAAAARPTPEVASGDPARILVSSGSETEPKMVAYSHDAFLGGRANYVRALHEDDTPMRNLVLVPLSSSFGSCGVPVTVAALGATLIVQRQFDPDATLRTIGEHRPTHVFGVPTMLSRLAGRHPPRRPRGLRALVSSGAPMPPSTERRIRAGFRTPVILVYGSTDGVNCHNARDGRPDPAVARITIADGSGRPLPRGATGEIHALGPMTPLSYVADHELNARYRTPGGWVRTGDHGFLDEQGVLHVTGRARQVVLRGGRSISPAEVELCLSGHPALAEVSCVGIPDPDLGELLCACIVPHADHPEPDLAELTDYLRIHHEFEPVKLPERLIVLPSLPLGPTGKVCRATLVQLAACDWRF